MKARNVLVSVVCFLLAAAALAQGTKTAVKATPVFTPAADLKWTDLDPVGAPGVKIADLWGNHATGAYGAYFKLPAGFAVPLHTHTHDMNVVFVAGTYIQAPGGKPEVRLGPGSYMMQPGADYRHTTRCDQSSDCVFLVESMGPFDLKVVEAPKAPAAK